ncbi:MAG: DEAD/DEAH box helicase [Anaerolineae bacterium]|nr:DEAD/DEAH box helicase [Anaerolineae bacterium]
MDDLSEALALKARLPRTWTAFFALHGRFTPAQQAAIPPILDGENILISAPTASGKTEAALAPLIERHVPHHPGSLLLLYIIPTRALANDLQSRLAAPLSALRIAFAVKTRDFNTFNADQPPALLITTPESLDSLLAGRARLFADLRAVVVDEIHLFDGTVRGDQLRVLMNRLRQVKQYAASQGHTAHAVLQYAALSATLARPEETLGRYFPAGRVVEVAGSRDIQAEVVPLATAGDLLPYLHTFRSRGWQKALVFCNRRAEVEEYAAAVRPASPFGNAVYVHYSNIDRERRREVEAAFARREVAICFATSTLELGIDIGNIDVVMLIGPPESAQAFAQRMGRSRRRQQQATVVCFARSPLEETVFQALVRHASEGQFAGWRPPFRPSVAVQQVFSLLKQSPTAAVRLRALEPLFAGMLSRTDLLFILGQLEQFGYLRAGRPGEWKAGPELDRLVDEQASDQPTLSIHSNLDVPPARLDIRDRESQRLLAATHRGYLEGETIRLEGRAWRVARREGRTLWVVSTAARDAVQGLPYGAGRPRLSFETARMILSNAGFGHDDMPLIETPQGWYCFHALGDLYGQILGGLLRDRMAVEKTDVPGLCLLLSETPAGKLGWSPGQVQQYVSERALQLEPLIEPGVFHHLLPPDLRRRAVVEQVGVARFLEAVSSAVLTGDAGPLGALVQPGWQDEQ